MLLYRELETIRDDAGLEAYKKRLRDRFGVIPHEGEELLQVVATSSLSCLDDGRFYRCHGARKSFGYGC